MRLTHRLELIKLTILLGILTSVILSFNLWAGDRWFPKTTFIENYIGMPVRYDYVNFCVLLTLLFLSSIYQKKTATILLVLFCIYLCVDDQNRLQHWFYNYVVMLCILLFYKNRVDEPNNYTAIFISLQLLVSLIYIFSGIQKMNSTFVPNTFSLIVHNFDAILSTRQLNMLVKFGYAVPFIEVCFGVFLLIKPIRFIIVPIVILMHVLLLITIAPSNNDYHYMIWPWNVMMIVLVLLLFAKVNKERFFDISFLFKSFSFFIVIVFMLICPVFSLNNKYDSFLSSSLFSSNLNKGELLLSNKAYHNLPYYIRRYCKKNKENYILSIDNWAKDELNAPCVPEFRIYQNVQNYIIRLTKTNSQDVKLNFIEREKLIRF
jgi:hypothetical protein